MTTFNTAKCTQRTRLAARQGINAVPVRFLSATEVAALGTATDRALWAEGTLPTSPDAAMSRINALLPEGAPALAAEDVYLHYWEAANTNFVRKYFFFLGKSTLRNMAKDGQSGTAFMNSHRTGGMSSPAELPFGKTFAGRFEQQPDGSMRTVVGVYLPKGIAPNGANGPTTDDLHAMILAGTLTGCSVGIPPGGTEMCDICQNELGSKDCTHAPGSSRNMSPDQRKAQQARGVPKGLASYTVEDAHMGELSAVFAGAVPGAGVRKVLTMHRAHQLSAANWQEAVAAYGPLLSTGVRQMDEDQLEELGGAIGGGMARALQAENLTSVDHRAMAQASGPSPEVLALQAEVATLKREKRLEVAQVKAHAEIETAVRDRKLYSAQNLNGEGEVLLAYLMCLDDALLTLADGQQLTPAACFRQLVAAGVPHADQSTEQIGATALTNLAAVGTDEDKVMIEASQAAARAYAEQVDGHKSNGHK